MLIGTLIHGSTGRGFDFAGVGSLSGADFGAGGMLACVTNELLAALLVTYELPTGSVSCCGGAVGAVRSPSGPELGSTASYSTSCCDDRV